MSAQGAHAITAQFEEALCKYTGSPYAVALDNCSNAIFLALWYELQVKADQLDKPFPSLEDRPAITIPKNTYPAVPCEIIHAGGRVVFAEHNSVRDGWLTGPYLLKGTNVVDSALRFTAGMYKPGKHYCLSFTGPYKHLKLGKGGAILTDDTDAYAWFKKARFSGRAECSYHTDDFDENPVIGWNFYMMPTVAAMGLHMMAQFYDNEGNPVGRDDLSLPYPDLSKFKLWS